MDNQQRVTTITLWFIIIGIGVYLVERLATITERLATPLLMFLVAWLLALIIEPVVDWLTQYRVSRRISVPLIYVVLLTLLTVAVVALIPVTYTQLNTVVSSVPELLTSMIDFLAHLDEQLRKFGWRADLVAVVRPEALASQFGNMGATAVQQSLGLAGSLASVVFNIIIVLILSYYMVVDGPQLYDHIIRLIPPAWRPEAHTFGNIISQTFGGYMRAQLLSSLLYVIVNAVMMAAFGLKSITLTSIIISIVVMVPLIGGAAALVPPVIVASIHNPDSIVPFIVVMLGVQQVLFNMLLPRIVGRIVGLHPLLVFAALLIGGVIAGAWGILFGIPLAGVVASIASYLRMRNQVIVSDDTAVHNT